MHNYTQYTKLALEERASSMHIESVEVFGRQDKRMTALYDDTPACGKDEPRTSAGSAAGTPKVLLVNGSPHRQGCTNAMIESVSAELAACGVDSTIHWLGNRPIPGCIDCGGCVKQKNCIVDDDVNEFRDLARGFDGFVFGAPVYFASANSRLTCFMDRLFFSDLWGRHDTFARKPAAAVVSARRAGCTNAFDELNKYFTHAQMPIVSSTYWNLAFGMKPNETLEDAEGMHTMKMLADNMAWLLKCIAAGRFAGTV